MHELTPTDAREPVDQELSRWRRVYADDHYYYGADPGPVARRAVRYHSPSPPYAGRVLDAGCGEGQDLAWLAGLGYQATGVEFTPEGAAKSRLLLQERGLDAEVVHQDLRQFLGAAGGPLNCAMRSADCGLGSEGQANPRYHLVLAVNVLQFLGADALECLDRLAELTAPGGVLALSFFARQPDEPAVRGTVWFTTLEELLDRLKGWQPLEAANLWQWNPATNEPQPFVTLIARRVRSAS